MTEMKLNEPVMCAVGAVDELSHTLHECDVEKLVGDFVQQFHLK